MLRKIRILLAVLCLIAASLLFVDTSGLLSRHLASLAKAQLVPAILAGGMVTVLLLAAVTFVFGRVYCSVVCPLGVFQDVLSRFAKKNRFHFITGRQWLRLAVLAVFVAAFLVGLPAVFGVLEPYSAFGRIATGLFSPVWALGNNALAYLSEKSGRLLISPSPIWVRGLYAFALGMLTLAVVGYLALRGGRTWCNTVCPVGTALGILSRFSIYRPQIETRNCSRCGLCERACKASCIDSEHGVIDATRCVSCFNCVSACKRGALTYSSPFIQRAAASAAEQPDMVRRGMLASALGFLVLPATLRAAEVKEETIPALTRKERRSKDAPVLPPGASGIRAFSAKCTGCQLCVSSCPNQVLASPDRGGGMLQPSLTFERGYCRANCVECSTVCPTGAIRRITVEEKSAIQIGRAVVDHDRCIRRSENVECTTCTRNCPAGAIHPIEKAGGARDIAVDAERCVGCGACEYFCPARPTSAILVAGNVEHRRI